MLAFTRPTALARKMRHALVRPLRRHPWLKQMLRQPSNGAFKILVWLTWYSLLSGLVLAVARSIVLYLPFDHPVSDVADVVAGSTLLGMTVLFMAIIRAAVSPKWGASVFPIVVALWMIATGITWWNCLLLPLVVSSNVAIDSVVMSMAYLATVYISGLVVSAGGQCSCVGSGPHANEK